MLQEDSRVSLTEALATSISAVADMHRATCDLSHPGTPSAAVAIVRKIGPERWEYAVLGDVTVVFAAPDGPVVVADTRISSSASAERSEADRWLIGSPEKEAAMVAMKHEELAARNRVYWIAAADPRAASHALTGDVADVTRIAILTDGAARAQTFGLLSWQEVLDTLNAEGPRQLINRVREAEASDPDGRRWPRNKKSDDATAVYINWLGGTTDSKDDEVFRRSLRANLRALGR
ncbi:MAG TPA: hypothetical protein VGL05_30210 [Kribbella sp.]